MGCDVHIHAEVKIDGEWEHYDQPRMDRNYEAFEKLAGVRGNIENSMFPVRGLPRDASAVTKFDRARWGIDGHTHSWISSEEIFQFSEWWRATYPDNQWPEWEDYLFGNSYSGFIRYPEDRPKGLQDVRFVFWFDN